MLARRRRLRDIGVSGGIDGAASSLDLTVRAAAALAEHHVRTGDRVGLRVVGADGERVRLGAGRAAPAADPRHAWPGCAPRRRSDAAGAARPRAPAPAPSSSCSRRCSSRRSVTATASLQRSGAAGDRDRHASGDAPGARDRPARLADLAWRMRRIERDGCSTGWPRLGCPVVPWRGPGTLDDVLHRLARRAQLPQVRVR